MIDMASRFPPPELYSLISLDPGQQLVEALDGMAARNARIPER
jgi:hypothetical protein